MKIFTFIQSCYWWNVRLMMNAANISLYGYVHRMVLVKSISLLWKCFLFKLLIVPVIILSLLNFRLLLLSESLVIDILLLSLLLPLNQATIPLHLWESHILAYASFCLNGPIEWEILSEILGGWIILLILWKSLLESKVTWIHGHFILTAIAIDVIKLSHLKRLKIGNIKCGDYSWDGF